MFEPAQQDTPDRLGQALLDLWSRQHTFNLAVEARDHSPLASRGDWTVTHLSGLMSRLDKVLCCIRQKQAPERHELGLELADLTKQVLCLWQLWGYPVEEALRLSLEKTQLEEKHFFSEYSQPRPGQPILLFDLDNTIFDFHTGFLNWLDRNCPLLSVSARSDAMHIPWHQHREYKAEFEATGGYAELGPYPDAVELLREAKHSGWFLIACITRPEKEYARVWLDTWQALEKRGCQPDQLRFGKNERLLYARSLLAKDGSEKPSSSLIYLEDNPDLAIRGAMLGLRTFVRRHPYNTHLLEDQVELLSDFTPLLKEVLTHA